MLGRRWGAVSEPLRSSNKLIGSFALKSCDAIVERPRWLVILARTSALGTPAFRQSVGMRTSFKLGLADNRETVQEQKIDHLSGLRIRRLYALRPHLLPGRNNFVP